MKALAGISASPGVAVGRAFLFLDDDDFAIPNYSIRREDLSSEWDRFLVAREKARTDITALRDKARIEAGDEQGAIFDSHLLMLEDPEFIERVQDGLASDLRNIERIVLQIEQELVQKLSLASDPGLRERTADIRDVSKRILRHLLLMERFNLANLTEEVVLVAKDLLPSDLIGMNRDMVKGIAMDAGGKTSHVAILARAFEIPAVLGLATVTRLVSKGSLVAFDGSTGEFVVEPDQACLERFKVLGAANVERDISLRSIKELPAETNDGRRVLLKANIEVPEEVDAALDHGAEGIGLYRSEFLFLKAGGLPTEDEQYAAYATVIQRMAPKPVTIRTLDIGGDKALPELASPSEKNPLLGWRAIRFCLSHDEVFRAQLRAILRASALGDARIMFPMISGPEELDQALATLEKAKAELRAVGKPFREDIPAGIMIEVPSAAMTADILAKKAAFFSIGTNDLIQYSMAVDRGNERVAYLYRPFHPAVLRLIRLAIQAAKAQGIPVGMCGEMAADPDAATILLGLGLDEFSMSSVSVPLIKRHIRSISLAEAKIQTEAVMALESAVAIEGYLADIRARVEG